MHQGVADEPYNLSFAVASLLQLSGALISRLNLHVYKADELEGARAA